MALCVRGSRRQHFVPDYCSFGADPLELASEHVPREAFDGWVLVSCRPFLLSVFLKGTIAFSVGVGASPGLVLKLNWGGGVSSMKAYGKRRGEHSPSWGPALPDTQVQPLPDQL